MRRKTLESSVSRWLTNFLSLLVSLMVIYNKRVDVSADLKIFLKLSFSFVNQKCFSEWNVMKAETCCAIEQFVVPWSSL